MQVRKSLVWKIIFPVLAVMTLLVIAILYYLPKTITQQAIDEAQKRAEQTVEQFKRLRGYYTENVVGEVLLHSDIDVTIDHKSTTNSIPLPATMVHELSEQFTQQGTQIKLYSFYPFPNRAERQLDEFAIQAWYYLKDNPQSEYIKVLKNEAGASVVRVAIADTLVADACVKCHNSHAFSPKVDWKLGDVRGILEVDSIIEPAIKSGEALGMKLALMICAVIAFLVMSIYVIHHYLFQVPLHKLAMLLEASTAHNTKEEDGELSECAELTYSDNHEHDEISFLYHKFSQQHERLHANAQAMREYQEKLEAEVKLNEQLLEDREAQLSATQHKLDVTQKELLQSEKLSALERLVSSIGHEVSTPLGVSKTASSFLIDETAEVLDSFQNNTMTRTQFEKFLTDNSEAGELINSNLTRAHELMQAFKQVAVDQISEQEREINLREYIQDVLLSLKPSYKNAPVEVVNNIDLAIELNVDAGAIAQIATNLLTNSLMHGFKDGTVAGTVTFSSEVTPEAYVLIYDDDGEGVTEEVQQHVFEQFYTTRQGSGGTGMGMYIIHELVKDRLLGDIQFSSNEGKGINIRISLPKGLGSE
ncbi:ATP-binding protein [Neptuniibacter sp. QD48_55]|uniref:ATP-binding protein n=1 Tax=Neptuniibacter sp. QD48_55 TaxID=3398212 RepID=UPI0039F5BE99